MKLKLTRSEFEAIFRLFNDIVMPLQPTATIDRMAAGLLTQIHNKIWNKGIKPSGYSLTLTEPEAIAFWCFWSAYKLPPRYDVFERSLLIKINTLIHQTLQL